MRFSESSRLCFSRFIAIIGSWIGRDDPEGLICVYAPNDHVERVEFFNFLFSFINN